MSFHSWLQSLRSALTPGRSQVRRRQRHSPRAATYRPNLEALEDRVTPSFTYVGSFPVPSSPSAMVTGDFNNDGHLDLATANGELLLGDGYGGFVAGSRFAEGARPPVVADVNNDGNLDLAVITWSGQDVSVQLGKGDGTFQAPILVTNNAPFAGMAVGDFDNDGNSDLVVGVNDPEWDYADVQVLLGDGRGGFHYAPYGTLISSRLNELAVGDVNADGRADVVTANPDAGTVSALLGNGDGTLYNSSNFAAGTCPVQVAIGDFTSDGIPDLITTDQIPVNGGGRVNVLPGRGAGTFAAPIVTELPRGAQLPVADFNGDGRLDVLVVQASDAGYGVLYLGRGDGSFDCSADSFGVDYPIAGAVGDFNGDGCPDVAVACYDYYGNTAVDVVLNNGDWASPPPSLEISDATVTEGNAGTHSASFTVTLSAASTQPITVTYAIANGTATAGSDYQAAGGTLTFAPGEGSKTITVLVNGDRLVEPNETFAVNLTGATNATIASGQGIGTILDDEPRINITDATVNEGNTGTRPITFTVSLSAPYDVPVTISYATANGTATAGSDYQASSGTLTIPAGQTSGTITVQVSGDRLAEPNETFFVNLSNPNYGVISDGQGVGTIVDDEPRISVSDVIKSEGKKNQTTQFTFTVTLSAAYDQAVTMSFKTTDGTAKTGDQDYVAQTGTLTFKPGETTKTITIVVNGDDKKEADETFYLDLFGNSSNSLFTKNRGIGTILNDD
jgi:hypothetical protein